MDIPLSRHFILQPLAEGAWAAIANPGGSAACNAGIIDLGNLCLVFDPCLTPSAAEDLRQAAISLVGKAPDLVIDSHYHNDHTWGNQVFKPAAHIVSSQKTLELIQSAGEKELDEAKTGTAEELAKLQVMLEKAGDDFERGDLELFVNFDRGLLEDLPRIQVILPDITFKDHLFLHGTHRTAELIAYDNGHTGNDTILFLPEDGIILMGDLLFVGHHPYLGDGDPHNLVNILKDIQKIEADCYVPGHGEVGTTADLDLLIGYIEDLQATAQKLAIEGSLDRASIMAQPVPEKYRSWHFRNFYFANLRVLLQATNNL
jgi:cyclase